MEEYISLLLLCIFRRNKYFEKKKIQRRRKRVAYKANSCKRPKFWTLKFPPLPQFYTRFLVSISSSVSIRTTITIRTKALINGHVWPDTGVTRVHNVCTRILDTYIYIGEYKRIALRWSNAHRFRMAENARNRLATARNTRNVSRRHGAGIWHNRERRLPLWWVAR